MSAFEQPPTCPKWQPLAHRRRSAFRPNLAESGMAALRCVGGESCRLKAMGHFIPRWSNQHAGPSWWRKLIASPMPRDLSAQIGPVRGWKRLS